MKAILKNYRQSPRKVRLMADLIRGKKVSQAETLLRYSIKNASLPILKLLNSATSNALSQGYAKEDLKVKEITVNGGYILKRMMPRARGSAFVIRKRTSLVSLNLSSDSLTSDNPSINSGQEKKVEKKEKKETKKSEETDNKSRIKNKKIKI